MKSNSKKYLFPAVKLAAYFSLDLAVKLQKLTSVVLFTLSMNVQGNKDKNVGVGLQS